MLAILWKIGIAGEYVFCCAVLRTRAITVRRTTRRRTLNITLVVGITSLRSSRRRTLSNILATGITSLRSSRRRTLSNILATGITSLRSSRRRTLSNILATGITSLRSSRRRTPGYSFAITLRRPLRRELVTKSASPSVSKCWSSE